MYDKGKTFNKLTCPKVLLTEDLINWELNNWAKSTKSKNEY